MWLRSMFLLTVLALNLSHYSLAANAPEEGGPDDGEELVA